MAAHIGTQENKLQKETNSPQPTARAKQNKAKKLKITRTKRSPIEKAITSMTEGTKSEINQY